MKIIVACIALIIISQEAVAQQIKAFGTVTTVKGYPISRVTVKSKIDKTSTISDSLGSFSLTIHYPDVLSFSYNGFAKKEFSVTKDNFENISIALEPEKSNQDASENTSQMNSQMLQNGVNAQSGAGNSYIYSSGIGSTNASFPVFTHKEDTKGSPYMLDVWANGTVYGADQNVITNKSYVYNYNKVNGSLIMTSDMQNAVEIDRSRISKFTLTTKAGDNITFVMVPAISTQSYAQLLAGGSGKYALYKTIKTVLKKANYQSTGLTSSGNPYDEYIDTYTYYIGSGNGTSVKEVSLKQKAVKNAFSQESAKLDSWFSSHRENKLSETGLIELVEYLNK